MKNSNRISGERGAALVLTALVVIAVLTVGLLWISGDGPGPASVLDGKSDSHSPHPTSGLNSGQPSSGSPSSSSPSPSFKPGKNPYSASKVCGKGYEPVDQLEVKSGDTTVGTVHLLYNAQNAKNCVTTLKTVDIKKKTPVKAWLEVKGGKQDSDSHDFEYYAGPLQSKARATCVKFGGGISGNEVDSGDWGHCGLCQRLGRNFGEDSNDVVIAGRHGHAGRL